MPEANRVIRLGILAVLVNLCLMLVKLGVGFVGNSYALVADGIESAADIFSSLITWAGFRASLKPPDINHPYGHGKIESLAGLFSGLSLFGAAAMIGWHSYLEIRTPHHAPAWFTLPVLVGVVLIKEWLSRRVFKMGHALDSNALRGDAWHHRCDAITSAAAALGITIALIGGPGYEEADDWAALATCIIILVNGVRLLRLALHDMLDGSPPKELYTWVARIAAATPGVENTEKCRLRKSGIDLFVEIHIRVEPTITVDAGHDISHLVKGRLIAGNPRIRDVIVHVEPAARAPQVAKA